MTAPGALAVLGVLAGMAAAQEAAGARLSANLETAWRPVVLTDPSLANSPIEEHLRHRRQLHRDVLRALKADALSPAGRWEAYRLLSILRVADARSVRELLVHLDERLPQQPTYFSPRQRDPFQGPMAARSALAIVDLPAISPLLAMGSADASVPGRRRAAWLLQPIAGACALPMAEQGWGHIEDEGLRTLLDDGGGWLTGAGSVHYDLRVIPSASAQGDLVERLNSDDATVRVTVAAELIRRNREAEQWLAEALAAGNPRSAAGYFHDAQSSAGDFGAGARYVKEWPASKGPPETLTEQARYECIQALGELRPLDPYVIDVLLENIEFAPETYPYRVSPAAIAAAKIGLPVTWRVDLALLHKDREERNRLLDVIGVMLGRFAAEPAKAQQRIRGSYPELEGDIAYLEQTYGDAPGIYEFTPGEPPAP